MKEPNIKSSNLTTLTISGQDSSDARKRVLDQLKEVGINSQGLVTNARCLTEGVDVPTLDGIAFIDPRASQVDIVQAVGRAIRKGGDGKKFGYIVIPIFFSQEEINEEIINESAFKPIWDVINALKSHDSKLSDEIDNLRIDLGKLVKPKSISEKIEILLPKAISEKFTTNIQTYILEKTSSDWLIRFSQLESFAEKFKHCQPPILDDEFKSLATWVRSQRQARNKNRLESKKVKLLENLQGWTWNPLDDKWMRSFNELVKYVNINGTARPPAQLIFNGLTIGKWASKQRQNKNLLSIDRIKILENLPGWSWDPFVDQWNYSFDALTKYFEKYHSTKVPMRYKYEKEKYSLGQWVKAQRYNKDKLSEEQILKLESFGDWSWNPYDDKWNIGFTELLEYVKNFGDARVPLVYKSRSGFRLGAWVNGLRQRKEQLTSEKLLLIQNLSGWTWNAKDQEWLDSHNQLTEYVIKNNKLPLKEFKSKDGRSLGKWVSHQRTRKRKGTISIEHQKLLEQIDLWTWDLSDTQWNESLNDLTSFIEKNNRLPKDKEKFKGKRLSSWIYQQKKNKEKLTEYQVSKLNQIRLWNWE
jgi:hypothetical protein